MATSAQIDQFIRAAHKVGAAGLTICSSGNLSWRLPNGEVLISGTGSWLPEITADRVSVVELAEGKILNGVKPSMESTFHLSVMRERPDVNVVLHFQSPYATALACRKERFTNLNFTAEMALHVGEEIPQIPYFRPGSPQLAEHVIEAMREHNSVLLLKHGQVVCGADFDQAFERAMFFEMGCRIALLNGSNVDPLTRAEIDDLESYFLGKEGK
ncbi:MAG: class II aldolase/adducin family protein [Paramuribaculum sp.]|nr:class II aldolase/adducin family protein [Paramuribaculum sp.]MDE6303549.1 class II aldolase/adducin family protein [Paramuribaculum sp.]